MTDRARHLVALYLETPREAVDADPAGAAARALRRLPQQGPLRRQKDRDVLKAIPKNDPVLAPIGVEDFSLTTTAEYDLVTNFLTQDKIDKAQRLSSETPAEPATE